ncbi:UBP-type zinc finger domain-containing protein [Vulgatibacter sp.]|uniref:UBP-type zinc finger domain-containing protein n=1 Tax=Vulgatibacter sp. TaxID=1971226 RepID=UPI00356B515B
METICTHLLEVQAARPASRECGGCVASGGAWVHLRLCLTCGYVGCCNSSENRHAMRHFLETGHPLVQSIEPHDQWSYCYLDEIFLLPQVPLEESR